MRRLSYTIDWGHFRKIKKEIVPTLFTEHQFNLIGKKFSGKKFSLSEKNEFSRTISRKMKALNAVLGKEEGDIFIYGKEKILAKRLSPAASHLKKYSRKFKNKTVIIAGSFLHSDSYKDIDIFVVSKYEKEEYIEGKFHISYLSPDVYDSVFFESLRQICISNRRINEFKLGETANLDTFISLYQELCNDLSSNPNAVKSTLREFLIQAAFIGKRPIPDSLELKKQLDSILNLKNPLALIKLIFVSSTVLGEDRKKAILAMKTMIASYNDIMTEYKQHKSYYLEVVGVFKEVIAIES